jgi:hypothetical protein
MRTTPHAMTRKFLSVIVMVTVLLVSTAWSHRPSPWTLQDFSQLDYPGANSTSVTGINDGGAIVGYYNGSHGFVYKNGAYASYDVPNSNATFINGINNRGDLVGNYFDSIQSDTHGFILRGQTLVSLDYPNSSHTVVWGLNDAGVVVGKADFNVNFLWKQSVFSVLTTQGEAIGINNRGTVIGQFFDGVADRGFILRNAGRETIDFPGAEKTQVWGLNDRGDLVGAYYDGLTWHGFLRRNAEFITIDVPSSWAAPGHNIGDTALFGINNTGDVVGVYNDGQHSRGFTATTGGMTFGK